MTFNALLLFATSSILFCVQQGWADEVPALDPAQVRATFALAASELRREGFAVRDTDEPPAVLLGDLVGMDAFTDGKVVVLNSNRPAACFVTFVIHEAGHWLLGRNVGMSPKQSEPYARGLEYVAMSDGWKPGCLTKE